MKVGIIGLEPMGEGMSRRLIDNGIEVWGYRDDYAKANEQYDAGYISGCTTSIEVLTQVVHSNKTTGTTPAVFMLVVPSTELEKNLDSLMKHCIAGDIIIDYSDSNPEDCMERQFYCAKLGVSYLFSGVYGASYAVASCSRIFQSLSPGNFK